MAIKITGTGSALPQNKLTNDDLAKFLDTNDEWIRERTGIRERRIVKDETTTGMAVLASQRAMEEAKVDPKDIDLIIVATLTPNKIMPSTACEVQEQIGAVNATCFDLNAACSGFVFALNTVAGYMNLGIAKTALVIGAETLSKIMDWEDRSACILFGDGAGAVVVTADSNALYHTSTGSNGVLGQALTCDGRKTNNPLSKNEELVEYVKMDGQEVFKFAVSTVPNNIKEVLTQANVAIDDIDCFLLHQANLRIIQSIIKRLHIDEKKVPANIDSYGNTSAASLPIILDEVNKKGMLKRGDKIVLSGFGGGLTWGSILMEW